MAAPRQHAAVNRGGEEKILLVLTRIIWHKHNGELTIILFHHVFKVTKSVQQVTQLIYADTLGAVFTTTISADTQVSCLHAVNNIRFFLIGQFLELKFHSSLGKQAGSAKLSTFSKTTLIL